RYDYLLESVISPLKSGNESIKFELYDKENDTYFDNTLSVLTGSIIIIEGVFLKSSEIKDIFDYMVYIDVPEEIRLERVLKRDTYIGETDQIKIKYENRYFPAERLYVKECSPAINADIVI
ncbi:MAG: uridine kinase, partial [Ruminiclostridium sp.]|nr:uridine kinase [Ruminiclostridium sp.]